MVSIYSIDYHVLTYILHIILYACCSIHCDSPNMLIHIYSLIKKVKISAFGRIFQINK